MEPDDGLRETVFFTLVDSGEQLAPSEIGDRVDASRQSVKYHLDALVDMGLVVRDEGDYYCQPLFIDQGFHDELSDSLAALAPEVEQRVFIDPEADATETDAVFNCIKTAVSMHIFDRAPDE